MTYSADNLSTYYQQFRVTERILLTGHSHQAWPDCALQGQLKAWQDAAEFVDAKWSRAFDKANQVRRGFAERLDDANGLYSLSQNTHDLLIRFLSALPLKRKPELITTNGEFHSIRRQLNRLEEEGIKITRVDNQRMESVVDNLIKAISNKTSAVLVSSVFFNNGQILEGLEKLASACDKYNTKLLIDVYHHINVVPFSIQQNNLENAYIIGGGYKYCQLGEGNCFLRFPEHCRLRPVITGWLAEFKALEKVSEKNAKVGYQNTENRFAGATYDPTSHYRAVEVFDFFKEKKLTPQRLRDISQHQIGLLMQGFDDADFDHRVIKKFSTYGLPTTAGFFALQSKYAKKIQRLLMKHDVYTDVRADVLRLGPAPYLSDQQLEKALNCLRNIIQGILKS